jgi:hypothetical protein
VPPLFSTGTAASLICPQSRFEQQLSSTVPGLGPRCGSRSAAQGWGRSWRQRLIRLLSAGWLPHSVSSFRGFPRSSRSAAAGGVVLGPLPIHASASARTCAPCLRQRAAISPAARRPCGLCLDRQLQLAHPLRDGVVVVDDRHAVPCLCLGGRAPASQQRPGFADEQAAACVTPI